MLIVPPCWQFEADVHVVEPKVEKVMGNLMVALVVRIGAETLAVVVVAVVVLVVAFMAAAVVTTVVVVVADVPLESNFQFWGSILPNQRINNMKLFLNVDRQGAYAKLATTRYGRGGVDSSRP